MQLFSVKKVYSNSTLKRVVALAIMIIITVSSVVTVAASTYNACIDHDGKLTTVQLLFSGKTDDILASAGIVVGTKDIVERSAQRSPSGEIQISVKSAYEVNVAYDHKVRTVTAHYGDTVAQTVKKAGISVRDNDVVTPSMDTKLSAETNDIQIGRKFHVNITADGQTAAALVPEGSVENALLQAGVTLGSEDTVSIDKKSPIAEGMKISVARITYQEVTATQAIPFKNTTKDCDTLYRGNKQVQTAGKNGSQTVVTRQKLVDGKVAGSEIVSTTPVEQPVDQVTLVGTKKKPSAYAIVDTSGTVTDQDGNPVNFKRKISGKCTAYTGGGTTSTGRAAAVGLVAVNPNVIPYGTRLYICSPDGRTVYGYAIAADTGGFAKQGRIIADLYYNTSSQCSSFGVRNMNIYVL
jgi:uncharacterized protein YabE (DUF348 family)/3D (Asp-Asp-Asp) domain-containing protein